jgi:hypothetical protein
MKRLLLGLYLAILVANPAWAAPKAEPWDRWAPHDPASTARIDHSAWDGLLRALVVPGKDGINRFAYGRVTREERETLAAYVDRLGRVSVGNLNRNEQRALWINLYNTLTVKVILDHYPVKTIRDVDISPGFFADGPWGRKLAVVDGEKVSLDDIEHRILRPFWKDPRVHYAVNCASLGCPNLEITAFTAANSEGLLNKAARAYVNHPRGAHVDKGKLIVSSIYTWFQSDFGGTDAGVIAHLRAFAEPGLKARLSGITSIDDDAYDWSLNEAN